MLSIQLLTLLTIFLLMETVLTLNKALCQEHEE
jgi:hypothetical protein